MATFVTVGKEWLIDKAQDVVATKMDWVAWGTGTTADAAGDTALQTAASEARVQGTLSQPTSLTDRVVATITANGTKSISEVGRFTASSGGTMYMRAVFTAIPVVVNDQIQFTLDNLVS